MSSTNPLMALLLAGVLGGCASFGWKPVDTDPGALTESGSRWGDAFGAVPGEGSDGSALGGAGETGARPGVVESPQRGVVQESAAPGHEVDSGEGGRMYILELYQKVVDEKDHLAHLVDALTAERDKLQSMLAEADGEIVELRGEVDRLHAGIESRSAEVEDLAGRLLTAQIRRLEAEKLLLEAKIEWLDAQERMSLEGGSPVAANEP